jgi:hypothetical protein
MQQIKWYRWWGQFTPQNCQKHPDKIWLFGDNEQQQGSGPMSGQAVIRYCPNAYGIPTKRAPNNDPKSFWSDDTFEENVRLIKEAVAKIPTDRPWIISIHGIGTGRANLPFKAPKTYIELGKILEWYGLNADAERLHE